MGDGNDMVGADQHGGDVLALLSSTRHRTIVAAAATAVAVMVVLAAAVWFLGSPRQTVAHRLPSAPIESGSPTVSPSVAVTDSPAPSPSLSLSPSPSPTKKAAAASTKKAPPPPKQVTVAKPPPPPPGGTPPGPNAPPPGAACPRLTGPVASRSAVADAMSAATGRSYRPTLSLNDNPPAINVRPLLVQGIGWEESGWQSTIESCDGGLGTMQVMTDTATWMNEKYGTNYDRASLTGNVNIATGFLAWLTRYFGDKYFSGNYSLAGDPNKIVLLDMVISAYQAGYGKVDNAMAANLDLPNRWYVDTVEGFMTHTPWTAPSSPSPG
jgi:hypothetical protein